MSEIVNRQLRKHLKIRSDFSVEWGLTAFFTAGHDGGVQAFAKAVGKVVDLVRAVDLDGLAGGIENHFAVSAFVQVFLDFGAGLRGDGVVDQVVKQGDELSACQVSALASREPVSTDPFFLRK